MFLAKGNLDEANETQIADASVDASYLHAPSLMVRSLASLVITMHALPYEIYASLLEHIRLRVAPGYTAGAALIRRARPRRAANALGAVRPNLRRAHHRSDSANRGW